MLFDKDNKAKHMPKSDLFQPCTEVVFDMYLY